MNQINETRVIPDSITGSGNRSDQLSTTTGRCQTYITQAAAAASRACVDDPLTLLFQHEKRHVLPVDATPDQVRAVIHHANVIRLKTLIKHDSFIAEAGNFAAVACWSPPDPPSTPPTESDLQNLASGGRLHFKDFLVKIERAKVQHLYPLHGHRYWHLSLMARDPSRPHVPGAVRAVIAPFIEKARMQNVPLWLCAGSEHARDVYAHFGFDVVDTISVAGVLTWCMILEPFARQG